MLTSGEPGGWHSAVSCKALYVQQCHLEQLEMLWNSRPVEANEGVGYTRR